MVRTDVRGRALFIPVKLCASTNTDNMAEEEEKVDVSVSE
jgi:hypothetical protein